MTAIAKPPPIVLGILAVGALWWLSQRRAAAGGFSTSRTGSRTGNPIYGTEGALRNSAVQRYTVPPAGTVPVTSNPAVVASGLNLAAQLLKSFSGGNSAPGAQLVTTPANAYGFDAVQSPTQNLVNAYSFGGPSMGVYGSSGADLSNGVPLGANAAYYGEITNPSTFTGDPYNDGGGYYDQVIASPAPLWNLDAGLDLNNPL